MGGWGVGSTRPRACLRHIARVGRPHSCTSKGHHECQFRRASRALVFSSDRFIRLQGGLAGGGNGAAPLPVTNKKSTLLGAIGPAPSEVGLEASLPARPKVMEIDCSTVACCQPEWIFGSKCHTRTVLGEWRVAQGGPAASPPQNVRKGPCNRFMYVLYSTRLKSRASRAGSLRQRGAAAPHHAQVRST